MSKIIGAVAFLFLVLPATLVAQDSSALAIVRKVADKVIREASFQFKPVAQKAQLGMQVVDLRHLLVSKGEVAYATTTFDVQKDTVVSFGVTAGGKTRIWINRQPVFRNDSGSSFPPKEFAYGRFHFDHAFQSVLKRGVNEILLRYEAGAGEAVVFLRPVQKNHDLDNSVRFNDLTSSWSMAVFPSSYAVQAEDKIKSHYAVNGKMIAWQTAPRPFLAELVIDSSATYQRDSYADWNYPNGAMLWSMMALGEDRYTDFVMKYCRFILDNKDFFQWQYESLAAYRGSFHRLFRLSMLDDSGAPALPFAETCLTHKEKSIKALLDPVADYVLHGQVRLQDGTFCRPEPEPYTVWADDLFMSVPFLLQMGRISGDARYYDEAARQALNFSKYLLDPATGLYKHGWFSHTKEQSVASWGRANGWVAWATAELLTWLPTKHTAYQTILTMFRKHMQAIARYQEENGMWHQVVNRKDSYEETSCTALFTLAMARGVRKGWLNPGFKKTAMNGWKAVQKNIDADGTVHGICRGTEIGLTETFYMERPTIDHDPRGLGAVITAGIEISKLK
jgi:unsaturated rhamnogalacturonyl hydrolase